MEMLTGAAILLFGILSGIGVGRRWGKHTKASTDPKPICGCKHHYSYHNGKGCNWKRWEYERIVEQCNCLKYTGPEPLPTYTTQPEIGSE